MIARQYGTLATTLKLCVMISPVVPFEWDSAWKGPNITLSAGENDYKISLDANRSELREEMRVLQLVAEAVQSSGEEEADARGLLCVPQFLESHPAESLKIEALDEAAVAGREYKAGNGGDVVGDQAVCDRVHTILLGLQGLGIQGHDNKMANFMKPEDEHHPYGADTAPASKLGCPVVVIDMPASGKSSWCV